MNAGNMTNTRLKLVWTQRELTAPPPSLVTSAAYIRLASVFFKTRPTLNAFSSKGIFFFPHTSKNYTDNSTRPPGLVE